MTRSNRMIALIGMPRSGTTWIAKIFDSHPSILYRHEPDMGLLADGRIFGGVPLLAPLSDANRHADDVARFITKIIDRRTSRTSGKLPFFPKQYYSPFIYRLRGALAFAIKAISRLHADFPIPDLVRDNRRADIRMAWKSIYLTGCLGVIAGNLKADKVILIVRHPCGQINSVLRGEAQGKFVSRNPESEDYALLKLLLRTKLATDYGLTIEILKELRPVERLAWRWVLHNEKAVLEARKLSNCAIAVYEDFCADPLAEAKKLFDFAGLCWHPQTEAFITDSTAASDGAYYSVNRSPLIAANKWRDQLSQEDIRQIMAIVRRSTLAGLFEDSASSIATASRSQI